MLNPNGRVVCAAANKYESAELAKHRKSNHMRPSVPPKSGLKTCWPSAAGLIAEECAPIVSNDASGGMRAQPYFGAGIATPPLFRLIRFTN